MPLQKLQMRPGVNREGTTLANEGGWFAGDKIRFRSGQVEKIGGWPSERSSMGLRIAMVSLGRKISSIAVDAVSNSDQ